MKNYKLIIAIVTVLFSMKSVAQVVYENKEKGQKLEIFHMAQFWAVSQQMDVDRMPQGADNRFDISIRRGRFGTKGAINKKVDFQVWYAFDLLGKDANTNFTKGMIGTNTDDKVNQVWDAFVKIKLNPKFNITAGFFRPQTSRESIRSGFGTMTFEKVFSNFIHRSYTLGKGPGRAPGINFGGTFKADSEEKPMGLMYDLGVFDAFEGDFVSSPLLAGRLTFFLGKDEKGMKDNHFGDKNGVILGVYGTMQSKVQQTALGKAGILKYTNSVLSTAINPAEVNNAVQSTSYGTDLLVNYKGFNLKAEYTAAKYTDLMGTVNTEKGDYGIASYDVIGGYTFNKVGPGALELALGYSIVDSDEKIKLGDLNIVDNKYGAIYGDVNLTDIGINYYLSKEKYKINLHYVIVDEKPTDANYDHYNNNFLALGLQYQW